MFTLSAKRDYMDFSDLNLNANPDSRVVEIHFSNKAAESLAGIGLPC